MRATTLVTGGSGYFGCVLVEELRRRGQSSRVLDLRDVEEPRPEVELVLGDIRDHDLVRRAVDGIRDVLDALTVPAYWILMSIAAYKGLWQLIHNPFFWEKTHHGLTSFEHEDLHPQEGEARP